MSNFVNVKNYIADIVKGNEHLTGAVKRANSLSERHVIGIVLLCLMVLAMSGTVLAGPANTLWTTISGLIQTWITRLGAVVMFVGGVMFGLGWKNDDAEQKSRGIQTLIAGAIVTAVAALTGTFFA